MNTIKITKADFNTTLREVMANRSPNLLTIQFEDGVDFYEVTLQRQGGALYGCVDCKTYLNKRTAWQVRRTQPDSLTLGKLLLMIGSVPEGTDPHEFFSDRAQ